MKKSLATPSLPILLRDQLIPWAADNIGQRVIVARPEMHRAEMPDGVNLERHELRGQRTIYRGQRNYGNTRIQSAEWYDEGLVETENPKLICVVNGRTNYHVGEYLLTCNAGYFFVLPPKTPHDGYHAHLKDKHNEDAFCDLLQIVAYRRGVHCWLCHSQGARHDHVEGENYLIRDKHTNDLFDLMMEEAVSDKGNHQRVCANLLSTFLLLLQREINAGRYLLPHAHTPAEIDTSPSTDFMTELNRYVLANLKEQLTLEKVAQHMHFSRSGFARRMREKTGDTFITYLTNCRLEEARTLLLQSEWTAVTIAQFVGYEPVYFHRVFREKMGMTPGQFRQTSRPKDSFRKK